MLDQPIDFSRKWYVLAAVSMGVFLSTIDGSIVNIALPTLVRDLGTDFATVQWVILAYLLTLTTLLLSVGRLGDMFGKKPIYTVGFIIFTVGSVLCGLSPNVFWLIGSRVIQAIGAAGILALGIAIVTEAFPPAERGKALGLIGTMVSVGIVVGPTLGGLIIDALSWNWIFFVNLPVGVIGTWMVWRFVPDFKPEGKQTFDAFGAITLFFSLVSLLFALTLGQRLGFLASQVLILLVTSLILLAVFIWIELRISQPMIDLGLFRNRLFSVNLVTGLTTFLAIAGALLLIPFYLENILGLGTRQVGFLLAVVPITLGISAPLSGTLSDRLGTRPITVLGLMVLVIGYFLMSQVDAQTDTLGFVLRFMPIGIGMGIFQSPNNSAVMGSVSRERLGVASGLLSITRSLGQTIGIAILGAVWAARVLVYSGQSLPGGATTAEAAAQVSGMQDSFLTITVLLSGALGLSVWGLIEERRLVRKNGASIKESDKA